MVAYFSVKSARAPSVRLPAEEKSWQGGPPIIAGRSSPAKCGANVSNTVGPDRPTGLLHALLRAADGNGEVTVEADANPDKLTKAENQSYTFDRIAWRTFHSNNNATVPCEETSRGHEKPSEHQVADEVFFGPQWNTTAGARIPRHRPYHVVDEGTTDIPDKMYRFEVRAADTGELVCIARSKVGAYSTARRLRLQGIETNIFLGTWERV